MRRIASSTILQLATPLFGDRVTSSDCGWMSERRSFCKNRQVQLPNSLRVGQYVNLDNLAIPDVETDNRVRLTAWSGHQSRRPIH